VDYAGRRLVAQTVIPGIFQNPTITDIIYGSNTDGEIRDSASFHELVSTAATVLSIAPSKLHGKDGAVHTLATSGHVKGLIGADGRSYLLEHVRTTPIDSLAPEAIREVSCYRRELLNNFIRSENLRRQQEAIQAAAQGPMAKLAEKQAQADGKQPSEDKSPEKEKTEAESEEKKEPEMVEFEYQAFRPYFDLNANSQKFKLAGTEEEVAEAHKTVDALGKFMMDSIPRLIDEDIVDGKSLREVMHQHGVNMRYLGTVAALAKAGNPRVYLCALSEVITRSAKILFNQIMERQPQARWATVIAAFLNLLLFPWQKGDNSESALGRTGVGLWSEIKTTAKERFQIELQDDAIKQLMPVALLRGFCQKNGIVLRSGKFNFHQHPAFTPGHILELLPKVKHMEPDSEVGSDGVNVALQLLRAGRKDEAYIAFTESANVIIHVCGSLTAELAFCWRYCASIALDFGNTQAATEFEARGLVVWEKLYGLDYHRAALNYYNLATQLHSKPDAPDNDTALNLASRSLYIQKLNGGSLHVCLYSLLALLGSDP
jgi:protein TIF31